MTTPPAPDQELALADGATGRDKRPLAVGRRPALPMPKMPVRGWRTMAENIFGYNMPLNFSAEDVIRDVPLEVVDFPGAFVSKREILKPHGAAWTQSGGVYDSHGKLLPEFEMMSDLYPGRFENPPAVDRERVAGAERIRRPCVYLGTLNGHFGHFLVESLARSWVLSKIDQSVGVVFHYANSAGATDPALLMGAFPSYITTTLDLLGVTPSRIEFANRDLRFDNLFVPNAQFWISQFGAPGLSEVYDDIREAIVRRTGSPIGPSRKLYLSRRRLTDPAPHKVRKNVANESEVEALFVEQGFESVALEQMPFDEQIMVMATASHIAGTTGSALHMAMFTAQPEAELIGIDWRNSRTQYILDAARGLRAHHIYCFNGRDHRDAPTVDVDVVAAALADVMSPAGAPGGPRQVYATALEAQLAVRQREAAASGERALTNPRPAMPAIPAAPEPPRLSSEAGVERFRTYSGVRPDGSRMARQTPALWFLLDDIQTSLGVGGDVLDVGAGLGATALIGLLLLKPAERSVAIDRHLHPTFSRNLELLAPETLARFTFLEANQEDLPAEQLPKAGLRLVHIDPQLRTSGVARQIEQVSQIMRPDGVLILNDFFEPSSPDLTTTVYELLRAGEWRVLMIAFNKVYLVRSASKSAYAEALEREAKAYLTAFGGFAISHGVRMAGDLVCTVKGNLSGPLMTSGGR